VRLFEYPDVDQAILQAAEHFQRQGLRPAIIEKNYYVTEALRIIAASAGDKVIFKGRVWSEPARRQADQERCRCPLKTVELGSSLWRDWRRPSTAN
jgi:hypothetical protein